MLQYFYDEDTKEFLYADEAFIDPQLSTQTKLVYIFSANTTTIQPLQPKNGYAVVFNEDKWEYVKDNRGLIVWKSYNECIQVKQLGAIPKGYTKTRPAKPITIEDYDKILEQHISNTCKQRGYTTRQPDVYLNSKNERWKQDALDFIDFRDECMNYGLEIENKYKNGQSVLTLKQFKQALPKIKWTFE